MIVFLNTTELTVTIYKDTGSYTVPFSQIEQIYPIIGNNNILYVTDAVEANAMDIIELVSDITGQPISPPPKIIDKMEIIHTPVDTGIKYIHSINKGPFDIPDLNAPPEEYKSIIKFADRYDIRIYDQEFEEKVKKYPIINQCIKSGKLKIINEDEKNKLFQERDTNQKNKQNWIEKEEQRRKNVASGASAEDIADNMFKNDIIIEEMDITDEVNSIKAQG